MEAMKKLWYSSAFAIDEISDEDRLVLDMFDWHVFLFSNC